MSAEELLALLQRLKECEGGALALYTKYLGIIADEEAMSMLKLIRDEEMTHVTLAVEAISLLKHGPNHSKIRTLLGDFSQTTSCFLSTGIAGYMRVNLAVLDYLINERGLHCIYIAVNKPSASLEEIYRREGIDVDAISFLSGSLVGSGDADAMVVDPEDLTNLRMIVARLAEEHSGGGFVFFDAVSSLYIFNPSNTVESFVFSLIPRLRAIPVGLVLVAVEEAVDRRVKAVLSSFTDVMLEL